MGKWRDWKTVPPVAHTSNLSLCRKEATRLPQSPLFSQFRSKLLDLAHEPIWFRFKSVGQQEHGRKARLALPSLQERQGGGMEARPLRECLVSEALLPPEAEKDVREGLSRVQVSILKNCWFTLHRH